MKIVHIDELPVEVRGPRGRPGMARRSLIMTGDDPDKPDNFSYRIMHVEGDSHYSPRHRHNFAQYYYVLGGEFNVGDAKLTAGWLGYMPEGVFYGPHTGQMPSIITLQHGGPSGQGIIGYDQHSEAFEALKKTGSFEGGVYRPSPGVQAPAERDSYEAIWEHVCQRRLTYPTPQYSGPITIDTTAFPWSALANVPGVEKRTYGTFTHANYGACAYKLSPGASLISAGRGMCLILYGKGLFADMPYRQLSTMYLDEGEEGVFFAEEETEILFLGLPTLAQMLGSTAQTARDAAMSSQ